MLTIVEIDGQKYQINLDQAIDISIPLEAGQNTVNCFYAPYMETSPVVAGDFIGSTAKGGPVNFLNVKLNPHGNGTHTECVGHIAKERYTINQTLKRFHFLAQLISVYPQKMENGDRVILRKQLEDLLLEEQRTEALIIRTLPNTASKLRQNYSGINPPYMDHEAVEFLVEIGIKHLLIDLPSVDREEDGGKLLAHKAFWKYPDQVRADCTISELVYVDNQIKDGIYFLNLQIASFEIDVSPSKPVLYHCQLI